MDSESARMSSAAEARFRIDYPNSKPRAVKVVALDRGERAGDQAGGGADLAARDLLHLAQVRRNAAKWRGLVYAGLAERSGRPHQGVGRGGRLADLV